MNIECIVIMRIPRTRIDTQTIREGGKKRHSPISKLLKIDILIKESISIQIRVNNALTYNIRH